MKTVHLMYVQAKRGNSSNSVESDNIEDDVEERTGLLGSEDLSIQA